MIKSRRCVGVLHVVVVLFAAATASSWVGSSGVGAGTVTAFQPVELFTHSRRDRRSLACEVGSPARRFTVTRTPSTHSNTGAPAAFLSTTTTTTGRAPRQLLFTALKASSSSSPLFYNDFEEYDNNGDGDDDDDESWGNEGDISSHRDEEEDEDDDDDEYLDVDELGDWKELRRRLATGMGVTSRLMGDDKDRDDDKDASSASRAAAASASALAAATSSAASAACHENAALLETQCEELAEEYRSGVWAHTTPTPEVGGLVLRMPLEAELFHGHTYNRMGKVLLAKHKLNGTEPPDVWYASAQRLVERCMLGIAKLASNQDGQIDASQLDDDTSDLLQLYLDHQETWQEVCLVLDLDDATKTATTLVLNRPMALKLTENLAQLVLFGADGPPPTTSTKKRKSNRRPDLSKFIKAFGAECAVYIGGPDDQDQPAQILHGIPNLPGAKEIATNSRLYVGGLDAAVSGILSGKYKPMDFRFFVGRHRYDPSEADPDDAEAANLHLQVLVRKYQPVACARSLVLKQCISLPKPLWHEVMELSGGDLAEISHLELSKRQDIKFQIVDDDDDDGDSDDEDSDDFDDEIIDELSELDRIEDDDDDEY